MVLEPILISICILLLISIGYFIYDRFQFLQQNLKSLSKGLEDVHQSLETSSKDIGDSVGRMVKEKLDFYFSSAYKVEQGNHWLNEADNEEDELRELTLLEQGVKRYPLHKEMHSQLFELFFNTLDNETALLRRKAILDRMIPISQDYRESVSIDHFDHANELFRKTEEAAKNLLDDLNQYKSDLVEERLEELFYILNEIESNLHKTDFNSNTVEDLVQRFKDVEDSIDKKIISQDESLAQVYKNTSKRFTALLKKASNNQENKKRKEYNLNKLEEIEKVSKKLKVHADNDVSFTNEKVQNFTKLIFIDKPELASDKLVQYSQSIFNELFTKATRNQRKLMTEITINLEYE